MGKPKRQPQTVWQRTRQRVWQRDHGTCQGPHCRDQRPWSLPLERAHIDHIQELCRGGRHHDWNLRTLCRRCHCLRANHTHQGLIASGLRDGILPPHWRTLVWED